MSYILDALKKVEQRREQEESLGTVSFLSESRPPRHRRKVWPYLLIGALLANVAMLVVWMWRERPPDTALTRPQAFVVPPATFNEILPYPEKRKEARDVIGRGIHGPLSLPPQGTTKKEAGEGKPAVSVYAEKEHRPFDGGQSNKGAGDVIPAQAAQRERSVATPGKTYRLADLPPDVRRDLPDFKISGHAYSPEVQTRVVRINEKILQEGQELSPGLRLEEIVADGVMMTYQGFYFRLGLNQGR